METHILSLDPILMIWDFLYKGSAVTLTPPAILKTFIDIIITQGQGKDKFTFCGISGQIGGKAVTGTASCPSG